MLRVLWILRLGLPIIVILPRLAIGGLIRLVALLVWLILRLLTVWLVVG